MIDLLVNAIKKYEMVVLITPFLEHLNVDKIRSKDSKEVIVKYFKKAIKLKYLDKNELYEAFGSRIALRPSEVEEKLNISTTERRRWESEGKLNVVRIETFNKFGKTLTCPYYDYKQINSITAKRIEKWRSEHIKKVNDNRKQGLKKAMSTKDRNKEILNNFYNKELVEMKSKWNSVDKELFATYNLAFWTMWVSRLAKQFQEKSVTSRSKTEEYKCKKDEFYQLKNRAMCLLSKSKYSKISFYRPVEHTKRYVSFCDFHYDDWCDERDYSYMDKWTYYYDNRSEIDDCDDCNVVIDEDYYSLYYLRIECGEVPNMHFSFHTPYPVSKDDFPDPATLEKVEHQENTEGLFRFGRSLLGEEVVVFTESRIRKHLEEAFELFEDQYINKASI